MFELGHEKRSVSHYHSLSVSFLLVLGVEDDRSLAEGASYGSVRGTSGEFQGGLGGRLGVSALVAAAATIAVTINRVVPCFAIL